MTFLSGESIKHRLHELIQDENKQPGGNISQVDCNSYELRVGPEVYITQELKKNGNKACLNLKENDYFTIPSGQFALILTEEFVHIPTDLFGFISMKSKLKLQGLINISGFHVDPGWRGRLMFSVYNAGPHEITLKRGDRVFLIWFAKMDIESNEVKQIDEKDVQKSLTSSVLNCVKGQVYSPQALIGKIEALERKFFLKWFAFIIALIVGFLIGLFQDWSSDYLTFHRGYKDEIIKGVTDQLMLKNKNTKENK